jgi:hypothetical protein
MGVWCLRLCVLCLFVSKALAANPTSTSILAMDQPAQFAFFTKYLKTSKEPCDRVNRVMYQGGSKIGVDTWSVACANGHSYAAAVERDANGSTKILTCAELKEIDAALMRRAGRPWPMDSEVKRKRNCNARPCGRI